MSRPETLHLERKHGPKQQWEKITVRASDPDIGLSNLKKHLPEGRTIAVRFTDDAAVILADFKIRVSGQVVHADTPITLLQMSGRYNLAINGVSYVAAVN